MHPAHAETIINCLFRLIDSINLLNERFEKIEAIPTQHLDAIKSTPDECNHQWKYGMVHTQCFECGDYCNCEFQPDARSNASICKHCLRVIFQ